jgi:hypothetical protein
MRLRDSGTLVHSKGALGIGIGTDRHFFLDLPSQAGMSENRSSDCGLASCGADASPIRFFVA